MIHPEKATQIINPSLEAQRALLDALGCEKIVENALHHHWPHFLGDVQPFDIQTTIEHNPHIVEVVATTNDTPHPEIIIRIHVTEKHVIINHPYPEDPDGQPKASLVRKSIPVQQLWQMPQPQRADEIVRRIIEEPNVSEIKQALNGKRDIR